MLKDHHKYSLLFLLLGALFYLPFLGGVHLFDWDEINFAEISREMMITQDYLRIYVDFNPFWEKPPFYFWAQVLAMKSFGVNEMTARLPNAVCGLITLMLLFQIGRKLHNNLFGYLWAGVYLGTILPHLYFKSGIIDPFFNLCIFAGLYLFILFYWKKERWEGIDLPYHRFTYLFTAGLIVGMGILTKGQVAYLVVCLTFFVYWIYQRLRFYVNIPEFLFFTLATTLVTLAWYGLETWKNGPWFITEFNKYQYRLFSTPDAGHKGFFGYHFVVLLIGCFPASIFTIRSFFKLPASDFSHQQDFRLWMKMFFWVVLILFSIVQSKIVHYSSLCYFPLTFLAALVIYEIIQGRIVFARWMKISLWTIGGLFLVAVALTPTVSQHPEWIIPFLNDPFAQANLEAELTWTFWARVPVICLFATLLGHHLLAKRQQYQRSFEVLFLGTAFFVTFTLIGFINNIEQYSQGAAIEFFKSKANEDCYVIPYGYRSYGHLFYTNKPKVTNPKSYSRQWLFHEPIDKDLYIIAKIHKVEKLKREKIKSLKEIGRKNGFVFFKREKVVNSQ